MTKETKVSTTYAETVLAERLRYRNKLGWYTFALKPGSRISYKKADLSDGRKWGMTKDEAEIREEHAQWPEAGIGIPTGPVNDIWVLDTDTLRGHGVDGLASRAELERKYGPLPETLTARTASGGLHEYWRWPKDGTIIRTTTGKLAPGMDVIALNHMVIGPPTHRPGYGDYKWINDVHIATPPEWLVAQAGIASLRNVEDRAVIEEHEPTEVEIVAAAVAVIPNNDYEFTPDPENFEFGWDDWNRMLMAIWRATDGSEAGFEIADTWSRKNPAKYNARETRARWKHFSHSPPDQISYGSIKWFAFKADPDWERNYDREIAQKMKQAVKDAKVRRKAQQKQIDEEGAAEGDDQEEEQAKLEPPKEEEPQPKKKLLRSSGDFVAGFTPPDYLIQGFMQRKFLYSFTGLTGSGKTAVAMLLAACVALGRPFGGKAVEQGTVLYFAGENPDDVCTRWIKLCEELKVAPATMPVHFLPGAMPIGEVAKDRATIRQGIQVRAQIEEEVEALGGVSLIIVDTNTAYFKGDDENDNVQAAEHARMLRSYVELIGDPTVLVTAHPTKNASLDNLLPRGGGSFLNEVDGNLVGIRQPGTNILTVETHGKFRGPEFAPMPFKIQPGTSDKIVDTKGNKIWTVTAAALTGAEHDAMDDALSAKQEALLHALHTKPSSSIAELAEALGWKYQNGEPNKSLVQRLVKRSVKDKYVELVGSRYQLTAKGAKHLEALVGRPV
jgi:AAA domain/Bifunctional DNA primase/polymerase, N-terminal/Primase C terminal 2 (PriCT-2)